MRTLERAFERAFAAPAAAAPPRDAACARSDVELITDSFFCNSAATYAPQAGACSFDLSEATVAKVLTCEGSIAAANMMCTPDMDKEACMRMDGAWKRLRGRGRLRALAAGSRAHAALRALRAEILASETTHYPLILAFALQDAPTWLPTPT